MSEKNIDTARLKVTIEATTAPYKKEAEKAKQISKNMTDSINKELSKVKNPLASVTSKKGSVGMIKNLQKNLKQSLASISPKKIYGTGKTVQKTKRSDENS